MKVTVYTTPGCMQCKTLMRKLDREQVVYDVMNLEQHPELTEQFKELGMTQAPIVLTSDELSFSGFRPDKINQLVHRVFRDRK